MYYCRNDRVGIQDVLLMYLFFSFVGTKGQQINIEECKKENKPICQKYSNHCLDTDSNKFGPNEPSWFIIVPNGRLGNHLTGFAVIQALASTLKITPLITQATDDYLKRYFDIKHNISIYEKTFCNITDVERSKLSYFEGSIDEIVHNKIYQKGFFIRLWPNGYKKEVKVCCPSAELFGYVYEHYLDEVKASLPLHKAFLEMADKAKADIAAQIGLKIKDITFVGLHDRRTDYIKHAAKIYGLKPFKKTFFKDAMDYFRAEFQNVVFLWISDDMNWGRKNFKNYTDTFFIGNGGGDIYGIGYDFALLSQSDHNIITRGTFGLWAALLSGGEYYGPFGPVLPETESGLSNFI